MSESLGFIHRYVPGSGRTLLLLHGTGGNENDLLPLGAELDPTAAALSPRGKVLENGMPRFFRRLAEGVYDMEDLHRRTHELADFVGAAAGHYGFTPDKVMAAGFSNGANIAAAMLLLRPGALAGAILLRPLMPLAPEPLPDLTGMPVFIAAGLQDPICPPQESESLAARLEKAGARVTVHWANAGHNLTRHELGLVRQWLQQPAQ